MIVLQKTAEKLHQLVEDSCDPDFMDSPSKMRTLRAAADGLASMVLGLIEDEKNETRQIIRTVEELEALDLDTVLIQREQGFGIPCMGRQFEWLRTCRFDTDCVFPLAVIATGEQVRAARKALEGA